MATPRGFRFQREHRYAQPNLSPYLDGRLSDRERARVDRHLAECADCCAELETLDAIVAALRGLAPRPLPCAFTLPASATAARSRQRHWDRAYGALRTATLVAAAFLVVLVAGDALLGSAVRGLPAPVAVAASTGAQQAPAMPAMPLPAQPNLAPAASPAASPQAPVLAMAAVPATAEPAEPAAPAAGEVAPGAGEVAPAAATASVAEATVAAEIGSGGAVPTEGSVASDTLLPDYTAARPDMGGVGGGGTGGGPVLGVAPAPPPSPFGAAPAEAVPGTTADGSTGLTDPNEPTPTAGPTVTPGPAATAAPATGAADAAPDVSVASAPLSATAPTPLPASPADVAGSELARAGTTAGEPAPAPEGQAETKIAAAPAAGVPAPGDQSGSALPLYAHDEDSASEAQSVYGLAPQQAVGVWQGVRIGAALVFGLLLILLSGTVWTGFQRRS